MPVRFLTDQCSITADLACQEFYIHLSTCRPNRSQSSGELSVTNVPMERSLHWHGEMSPAPAACCSWSGSRAVEGLLALYYPTRILCLHAWEQDMAEQTLALYFFPSLSSSQLDGSIPGILVY